VAFYLPLCHSITVHCSSSHRISIGTLKQSVVDVLVVRHIPDYLVSISEDLAMVIRNLEPKLILHGNDNFHMVQAVQAQVLDEVRLWSQLFIVNLVKEIEHQHHPLLNEFKGIGLRSRHLSHLCHWRHTGGQHIDLLLSWESGQCPRNGKASSCHTPGKDGAEAETGC